MSATAADEITVDQLWDDPFPIYAEFREHRPVCFVPAVGLWFVTRWADVERAAARPDRFPAAVRDSPLDRTLGGTNVLTVDGEEHKGRRAPMYAALRPRALDDAEVIVQNVCRELLAAFEDRGAAELMGEYFEPMSVLSVARVIGLGEDLDAPTLQRWFHGLAAGTSNFEGDPAKQRLADDTGEEVSRTLRPRLEYLLREPDGSMVSEMLLAADGDVDERLAWVLPTLKLALIGGLQEPGHGAGSTVCGLLGVPEQAAALAADVDGLIGAAVDEGLRWLSPIGTQTRVAGRGAELSGVPIPTGENVGLMVQSANRDREVFGPTADDYDLFRPRQPNAAFGFGPHFCVGNQLARTQLRVSVGKLFQRLPGLRLDRDRPPVIRGWEYRGPVHLHVRWDA